MTRNLDTSAHPAAQPWLASHKEALGSAVAPLVINQDTITEHTTYKKSHVAQIGLHRSKHYVKEG